MNRKLSKKVKQKSILFVVEWLKSMLIDKEKNKVSEKNYKKYLPEETHIFANKTLFVSSYTPRWFAKKIKKFLKYKSIDKIQYEDII
jgi:alkyl sulfatase BDS1-like metallo-beta-lactamase superfamily hydrolase